MKDIENMTIKEIRIESQNMQYDLETSIKDVFKKYEFIKSISVNIDKNSIIINRNNIDGLVIKPIIDIKI